VIKDTALPKEGTQSVEVAPQYAGAFGKKANTLVFVVNELGRWSAIPGQEPGAAVWSDCEGPAKEPSRRRLSKL
jgi:hypothetical protein